MRDRWKPATAGLVIGLVAGLGLGECSRAPDASPRAPTRESPSAADAPNDDDATDATSSRLPRTRRRNGPDGPALDPSGAGTGTASDIPSTDSVAEWTARLEPHVLRKFEADWGVELSGSPSISTGRIVVSTARRRHTAHLDQEWKRAVAAAAADVTAHGAAASHDEVRRLLASSSGDDLARGIALATGSRPPDTEALRRVVQDPALGTYRALALLGLAQADARNPDTFELVRTALYDDDLDVRAAAHRVLSQFGAAGAEAAIAILRDGSYASETLDALAAAIDDAGQSLTFLRTAPSTEGAVAVLVRLAARRRTPAEQEALDRELGGIAHALCASAPGIDRATDVARALSALGAVDALVATTLRADLPSAARRAAAIAGISDAPSPADTASPRPERREDPAVALLRDPSAPADLVRDVLAAVSREWLAMDRVRDAVVALEATHANPWVRADALARLLDGGLPLRGGVTVVSGVYGLGGEDVDVTTALRNAVAEGRLRIRASNEMAGDPSVGVRKLLRVEYVYDGRRRVRQVWEGELLVLP